MSALPQNVKEERSGWRDERLSRRHRRWGWDVPCVDIDWLVGEYDTGRIRALVEYKHHGAKEARSGHTSYRALRAMANDHGIPFFAVRYDGDNFTWYRVTALNPLGRERLGALQKTMTEYEYVFFMYEIRGRKPPQEQTVAEWLADFELAEHANGSPPAWKGDGD